MTAQGLGMECAAKQWAVSSGQQKGHGRAGTQHQLGLNSSLTCQRAQTTTAATTTKRQATIKN